MLATTTAIIMAGLRADPTVPPADRARILVLLRQGPSGPKPNPEPTPEPRLVRRKEAACRLGVSLRSLDKLAKEGILPKRVLPGRIRASGFLESTLAELISGKSL